MHRSTTKNFFFFVLESAFCDKKHAAGPLKTL